MLSECTQDYKLFVLEEPTPRHWRLKGIPNEEAYWLEDVKNRANKSSSGLRVAVSIFMQQIEILFLSSFFSNLNSTGRSHVGLLLC